MGDELGVSERERERERERESEHFVISDGDISSSSLPPVVIPSSSFPSRSAGTFFFARA